VGSEFSSGKISPQAVTSKPGFNLIKS